jgi:hypothetical protein
MRRLHRCIPIAAAICAMTLRALPARCGETITLDQAIGRALEVAPSLANAAANSDLNLARVYEARAPLYPRLGGAAEYTQSPTPPMALWDTRA